MDETTTHLYPGVSAVDGECEIVRGAEGVEPGQGPREDDEAESEG